jgi:hypothetical protein
MEFQSTESIREVENYRVDLSGVTILELVIDPDIRGGFARAPSRTFVCLDVVQGL